MFLPDQLRADTIVGANASAVHAPNLHKLASQAVVFERTYITHPICAPSRSSLLSGTWPHANGCTNNQAVLAKKFPCLPQLLADSDYRAAYFGKWHLGDEFSAQRGFEEWSSIEEFSKSAEGGRKVEGVSDYTKFLISNGYKPDFAHGRSFSQSLIARLPVELRKPKFLEVRACQFLQDHRDQPFILFVAFFEPHPPYEGPLNKEHPLESVSLDPSAADTFGDDIPLHCRLIQEACRKRLHTTEQYRETKQKYLGLITEVDRCIGTILSKLDDLGLTSRTITVLTSDHGDMMSGHGLLGKRLMFEQSARVPYLVRMPEQQRPLRYAQPLSHIDFVPTMLELLGKTPVAEFAGQSRAYSMRGDASPQDLVFIEWAPAKEKKDLERSKLASKEQIKECLRESTRAVVSPEGWKLCLRDKDKNELYNLRDDPDERHNLYYGHGQGDVIDRLTREIHLWQQRVGDTVKV